MKNIFKVLQVLGIAVILGLTISVIVTKTHWFKNKRTHTGNTICSKFINNKPIWDIDFDPQGKAYLINGKTEKKQSLEDYSWLAEQWNGYNVTKIEFKKVQDSIVYLRIPNASVLTEQSGSFGARATLAALIYTFTERRFKYQMRQLNLKMHKIF